MEIVGYVVLGDEGGLRIGMAVAHDKRGAPLTFTLAVITATWNNATGLARTMESLALQKIAPGSVQHIVVDGCSSDDSRLVFDNLRMRDAVFLSEPDSGVYDAMNKGLALADADYVQFLNAGDSFATQSALAKILESLRVGQPTWLICGAQSCAGDGRPTRINNLPHVWWRHALGLQPHCHQACFFQRSVLQLLGGHALDVGLVADFDLILRVGLVSAPMCLEEILVAYEGGGMSARAHADIPGWLTAVRDRRFELTGGAALANHAFGSYRRLRQSISFLRRRLTDDPRGGADRRGMRWNVLEDN